MLDACFSQLCFGPSFNTLQLELPAIAGLLVVVMLLYCLCDVSVAYGPLSQIIN